MTNKEKIINYVMETPGNSNRAVLSSMLDEINKEPSIEIIKIYSSYLHGKTQGDIDNKWYFNVFPVKYATGKTLKEIIGEKTIIDFRVDCDSICKISNVTDDSGRDIIVHQFDEGFLENESMMLGFHYLIESYVVNFTIYAICI